MKNTDAPKLRLCILMVIGLLSLLGAWSYKQIDTVGDSSWVEIEVMPTGTICICYHDSISGHIFVARKDSVWRNDDLGEWNGAAARHLVVGPGGKPAVLLESDTVTVYTVLTDSGWIFTTVHCTTGYTFLAFDSSGNASLFFYYVTNGMIPIHNLASAYEQDGAWTTDLIDVGYYDGLFWYDPEPPTTFVLGPGNRFYNDRGHFTGFTMGNSRVFVDTGRTSAWGSVFSSPGRYAWGVSMSPSPSSDFVVCYVVTDQQGPDVLLCNYDTIEAIGGGWGKVRVDSRGIRQIVYRCDIMKLAYRTNVWHKDTLPPEINAATSFDFAVDANDMPLIAFSTPNGIFLATGDAVGATEKPPQVAPEPPRLPTIMRGVLFLPRPLTPDTRSPTTLLDIGGRQVAKLHAGANDVSRLAPGVYFVRGRGVRGEERAEKIVIQR